MQWWREIEVRQDLRKSAGRPETPKTSAIKDLGRGRHIQNSRLPSERTLALEGTETH
jgi:hypothetical protein